MKSLFKTLLVTPVLAISALVSVSAFASGTARPEVPFVKNFDSPSYLGTWYEIGSIPQSFQKGCTCTRANYSMLSDGKIDVLNECRLNSPQGQLKKAHGKARFAGPSDEGHLQVSFFLWFWGDYRVIDLDSSKYSVVSNSDGSSMWILSRTPTMDRAFAEQLIDHAKELGVQTDLFRFTGQDGCEQ